MSDAWVMPQSEPDTEWEECGHGEKLPKGDAPEQWCDKCLQAWRRREHELIEGRSPEEMGRP